MGITVLNVQWLGDQMFLGSLLLLSTLVGVLATHLLLNLRSDKSEEILWLRVITRQFRNAHLRAQQEAEVLSSRK